MPVYVRMRAYPRLQDQHVSMGLPVECAASDSVESVSQAISFTEHPMGFLSGPWRALARPTEADSRGRQHSGNVRTIFS